MGYLKGRRRKRRKKTPQSIINEKKTHPTAYFKSLRKIVRRKHVLLFIPLFY